jgi:hypothetical protein
MRSGRPRCPAAGDRGRRRRYLIADRHLAAGGLQARHPGALRQQRRASGEPANVSSSQ